MHHIFHFFFQGTLAGFYVNTTSPSNHYARTFMKQSAKVLDSMRRLDFKVGIKVTALADMPMIPSA